MADKTLFQKIADKEIPAKLVYEDDVCIAFHDIAPQAPTYILVVPRKPIPRVGAATVEDQATLGHLLLTAGNVARELGLENGFRTVINNGPDAGETVPHLHVHVVGGSPMTWPPG